MRTTKTERKPIGFLAVAVVALAMLASAASASAEVKWEIDSLANSTAVPGDGDENTVEHRYTVRLKNAGDSAVLASGNPIAIAGSLPAGMTFVSFQGFTQSGAIDPSWNCPTAAVGDFTFTCENNSAFVNAREVFGSASVAVSVAADAMGVLTSSFSLSGGAYQVPDPVDPENNPPLLIPVPSSSETIDPTAISATPPGFGVEAFDVSAAADPSGITFTRAGAHPYALATSIDFNTATDPDPFFGDFSPIEPVRDVLAELPAGFVGNPVGVGQCRLSDLALGEGINGLRPRPGCSTSSQIGTAMIRSKSAGRTLTASRWGPLPIFNLTPSPGAAARFGFNAFGNLVVLEAKLQRGGDYRLLVGPRAISQGLRVTGSDITFWGNPADERHRDERACPGERNPIVEEGPTCPGSADSPPFLRMPTSCTGEGMPWGVHIDSWDHPAVLDETGFPDLSDPNWKSASILSHKAPGYPRNPNDNDLNLRWGEEQATTNCEEVPVKAKLSAQPTSIDTETSSGLQVHVEVPNVGLENDTGISTSDIKAVEVALPEGLTVNPSQAEGLGVCSPGQLASTRLEFHPDGLHGCPSDSKIGSVEVKTPLLEETIPGDVYIATPYDNPFNSLLALYVVLHNEQRGILVKLPGKVSTNATTGQISADFQDLPQLPFSTFEFKFREGARAPLVTPAACGTYTTTAEFTPWSDPDHPITRTSDFQIVRGIGGGSCPSGGLPPFKPGLIAGSVNNAAGKFSPFNVRLFRTDAEQEFTNFSIKLPPGISGKLAGVPFCSDAAIAAAKSPTRTGAQELASPSCPAASEVGRTLAGAGVGSVLTYAPGKIYLAGPYNGSALSIVSVTAAKVGPFDLGTVVVRLALRVDPETAEVFVDATGSDPIPHIIDGITVHLRDIRAYVDKHEFALNPTSCKRTSTSSTLLGSGLDFSSAVDDRPVTVSTPYQAADCAALGFKPELALSLKGGTKRAGHPSLKAVLKMKPGMANISRIQATLPKSEFLDQSHIGTVCTRVQYVKDQCPAKSIYGYARAFTPILDEPLQGPVYLRSSEHKLPDLVAGLKSGKIEIDVVGRIDSLDGRIRSTFETVPDAPLTKAVLVMQGGKKGLLENSTNLCAKPHRAILEFDAHNGKVRDFNPVLKPDCKAKRAKKKR